MKKLEKPKQLEAIVYNSKEDNCFVAHSINCDQLGTGDTKEQAIRDLGVGLKNWYNLCEEDETLAFYSDAPPEIQQALEKAKSNPDKHKLIIHEVPGYFKIKYYDFTEEDFSVD